MNLDGLINRAQVLQNELQRAKQSVAALTEQLEAARAHQNMVLGHLNEVGYLMGEAKKENSEELKGDKEHVKANEQIQEQTS